MKKTLITILILFTLTLTACGASSAQAANPTGNTNGNNGSFGTTPLPLAMELVVGTFKLEGTDNAVTADEAAQLLPLWQVYKDLSASTSAAQQEIDALAEQIQGTMTPEQVQAITDMKLTRRDIFQTMQDLGHSIHRRTKRFRHSSPRRRRRWRLPGWRWRRLPRRRVRRQEVVQ